MCTTGSPAGVDCAICIEKAANIKFKPCGHEVVCGDCYPRATSSKCPYCRQRVIILEINTGEFTVYVPIERYQALNKMYPKLFERDELRVLFVGDNTSQKRLIRNAMAKRCPYAPPRIPLRLPYPAFYQADAHALFHQISTRLDVSRYNGSEATNQGLISEMEDYDGDCIIICMGYQSTGSMEYTDEWLDAAVWAMLSMRKSAFVVVVFLCNDPSEDLQSNDVELKVYYTILNFEHPIGRSRLIYVADNAPLDAFIHHLAAETSRLKHTGRQRFREIDL